MEKARIESGHLTRIISPSSASRIQIELSRDPVKQVHFASRERRQRKHETPRSLQLLQFGLYGFSWNEFRVPESPSSALRVNLPVMILPFEAAFSPVSLDSAVRSLGPASVDSVPLSRPRRIQ